MISFDLSSIIISIQCDLSLETHGQNMAVRDQTTDHPASILSSSPTNLSWKALLPTVIGLTPVPIGVFPTRITAQERALHPSRAWRRSFLTEGSQDPFDTMASRVRQISCSWNSSSSYLLPFLSPKGFDIWLKHFFFLMDGSIWGVNFHWAQLAHIPI